MILLALGPTVALGGVHRPVQLAACALSLFCLILVWMHRRPHGRGLRLPLFGGALLVLCAVTLLQMIPLPLGLLKLIAPATVEVLEISLAKVGGVPSTHPISLDPGSTQWEALKLACYAVAFIAGHNFYYRRARRRRRVVALVGGGLVVMFVGPVGAVVAPGIPLMLYTPEAGRASGLIATSFVNPNHSAGFLTICALLAMGLAIDTRDLQRKILLGLAAVMLGCGVMLTVSRGGILALALGMGMLAVLALQARRRINLSQAAVVIPGVVALTALLSAWLAWDRLLSEFSAAAPDGGLGKLAQWPSGLDMVLANPWVGVGRGAFMTAFPRYLSGDIPLNTYEYMENQFIQLPAEYGLPLGTAFMAVAVVAWLTWLRRGRGSGITIAAVSAIFALAAHNLVDFSFEMPGVGIPLCLLAGALSAGALRHRRKGKSADERKRQRRRSRKRHTAATLAAGGATALLLVVTALTYPKLPRDDDRTLAELAEQKAPLDRYLEAAGAATRRHPSDYMPHLSAAHQATLARDPRAIGLLNRALFLFPRSPKIHLQTARALMRFGARRQALLEYRMAMEHGAIFDPVLREAIPLCRTGDELRALLLDRPKIHAQALHWLRKAGRLDLAGPAAERSVERWPDNPVVCLRRAEVLLALKDKRTIAAARACVARGSSLLAYGVLARASMTLGPTGSEIEVLLEARKHFPDSLGVAERLARAYLRHKKYPEALKAAEQMLAMATVWQDRARAHRVLSRIHLAQGQQHSADFHKDQARVITGGR